MKPRVLRDAAGGLARPDAVGSILLGFATTGRACLPTILDGWPGHHETGFA